MTPEERLAIANLMEPVLKDPLVDSQWNQIMDVLDKHVGHNCVGLRLAITAYGNVMAQVAHCRALGIDPAELAATPEELKDQSQRIQDDLRTFRQESRDRERRS